MAMSFGTGSVSSGRSGPNQGSSSVRWSSSDNTSAAATPGVVASTAITAATWVST